MRPMVHRAWYILFSTVGSPSWFSKRCSKICFIGGHRMSCLPQPGKVSSWPQTVTADLASEHKKWYSESDHFQRFSSFLFNFVYSCKARKYLIVFGSSSFKCTKLEKSGVCCFGDGVICLILLCSKSWCPKIPLNSFVRNFHCSREASQLHSKDQAEVPEAVHLFQHRS